MRILATSFCLVSMTLAAHADKAAADSCAGGLDPAAKAIYDTTIAAKPTPATARGLVVDEVKKQIAAGNLTMSQGRAAGQAAGTCLKMLEQ